MNKTNLVLGAFGALLPWAKTVWPDTGTMLDAVASFVVAALAYRSRNTL